MANSLTIRSETFLVPDVDAGVGVVVVVNLVVVLRIGLVEKRFGNLARSWDDDVSLRTPASAISGERLGFAIWGVSV